MTSVAKKRCRSGATAGKQNGKSPVSALDAAERAADGALGRLMASEALTAGDVQEQLQFLTRQVETWALPEQALAFPDAPVFSSAPIQSSDLGAGQPEIAEPAPHALEAAPRPTGDHRDETLYAPSEPAPSPAAPEVLAPESSTQASAASKPAVRPARQRYKRWVKTAIALLLAVIIGWMPLQRLLSATSAEATINARIVTVRAPIDGQVTPYGNVALGASVQLGDRMFGVSDRRANRNRVDDLKRTISEVEGEVSALTERRRLLRDLQADLAAQRDRFVRGRTRQLQARVEELEAEIAAAEARQDETKASLDRARELNSKGFQSEAVLQRAASEATVAEKAVAAARQRLKRAVIERDAAQDGVFIGENFNDIPRSQQRVDELEQQIVLIDSELGERGLRLKTLRSSLGEEEARYQDVAFADVTIPATGRVWEVLTAPGEEVHRGQPLMKVLDCGGTVVTAAVSEGTYNLLRLGAPASFHLRGETTEHAGRIISLNGLADATANLAIAQKALAREPYHVTVEVPGLGDGPNCNVGRTGMVTFDTSGHDAGLVSKAYAKP